MALNGLLGDPEAPGELRVRGSGDDTRDDLQLAFARPARGQSRRLEVGRAEDRPAGSDRADRIEDRGNLGALVEIAGGATLDRGADDRGVPEPGHEEDRRRMRLRPGQIDDVEALGAAGELDVADEDIDAAQQPDGVLDRAARSHEDQIAGFCDGRREGGHDRRVVVDEADADRRTVSWGRLHLLPSLPRAVNPAPGLLVPSDDMRSLAAAVAALALVGCGDAAPTGTPPVEPPRTGESASPSPGVEALLGPWRRAPVAVGDDLTEALRSACAGEAGPDLLVDASALPVAVVDARGQGRATVLLADDSVAVICEALIEADGETVAVAVPPTRIAPDALGTVDDGALEIAGYGSSDDASEPRTAIVGRVGRSASEVIAAFDDESEVYAAKANGWFLAWWPGALDPDSVAAVDARNIVLTAVTAPEADVSAAAGPASWWVDPSAPPAADATSIRALIRERACASGRSPEGRVVEPQVFAAPDALLITVWVRTLAGGRDCQGNPEFPLEIQLAEPLGERRLLDGSEIPPRDATEPPP